VLNSIFGPKGDDGTGKWRELHNEELNKLYSSPNIVRVMRRMRWVGHVARIGRIEVYTGFWCGNLKERDHLEDPGLDVKIILSWILMKRDGEH